MLFYVWPAMASSDGMDLRSVEAFPELARYMGVSALVMTARAFDREYSRREDRSKLAW